jgi:hypothetical protein
MKKGHIDREIRMVITYNKITEGKFWNAFESGLKPHLTQVRIMHPTHGT